jgi:hypothetical protein
MPLRVKARRPAEREMSPVPGYEVVDWSPPYIGEHESFKEVIEKISMYVGQPEAVPGVTFFETDKV